MMRSLKQNTVLHMVCAGLLAMPITAMATTPALLAQAAAAKTNIDDTWQGTLHVPQRDLRLVVKIAKGADGKLTTVFYSIDQGGQPLQVKTTTFQGGELNLGVDMIDGTYVGKLSPDGSTLTGEWKQGGGNGTPLVLVRATPETAWAIPEPPKKIPPMAADADPSYEIATIKLSPPDRKGKGFGGPPGKFMTRSTALSDLIMYAYKVHVKQIVGAPSWWDTEKFDIEAKFDTPGQPSNAQSEHAMQKLLVSRFGLKFHEDKREMPALVMTVAKEAPRWIKARTIQTHRRALASSSSAISRSATSPCRSSQAGCRPCWTGRWWIARNCRVSLRAS